MDLYEKIRALPRSPACTSTRTPRAKSFMWARPRTFASASGLIFWKPRQADAKTGSLMREAVDLEYIW